MRGKKRSGTVYLGGAILAALALIAILAPVLAPFDPHAIAGPSFARPSSRHLLGTTGLGRDVFSELVWGARQSLFVAVGASVLAQLLGVVMGVGATVIGGPVAFLTLRVMDLMMSLPMLPLLVLVAALVGPSPLAVTFVIAAMIWPFPARILRSQTLSLYKRGFVLAAAGLGAGPAYVVRRHLVPALGPVIVTGFVRIAGIALFLEAGLAFLGLGNPGGVSWGLTLNRALASPGLYLSHLWLWLVLPASLAIALAVLGFTLLGIGLDTQFNPRSARQQLPAA